MEAATRASFKIRSGGRWAAPRPLTGRETSPPRTWGGELAASGWRGINRQTEEIYGCRTVSYLWKDFIL